MAAAAEEVVVEETVEMASYETVEFPPSAGVAPPLSSSQEASTPAPGLLDGDHGGHLAAAQVTCGKPEPEPAPALCTSAQRYK
nr:unnamed protein product [Digitaria exilis]